MPVKNLSYWPGFPIALSYHLEVPDDEDDVITLFENSDRVRLIKLNILKARVVAAMQGPFPVLTHLELSGHADLPVLPGGFLGGSAPCLQEVVLSDIPFPALPTLLSSTSVLVSLQLKCIPPTGYISPDAMVARLAKLTRLETLRIMFPRLGHSSFPEQIRSCPDPPMRVLLPALTNFEFGGWAEYLEDFVAQIDAPRLVHVRTDVARLDTLRVPQLFLFLGRAEILRFRRAQVAFSCDNVYFKLRVDRVLRDRPSPHFSLFTYSRWPGGTHVAHVGHVLTQIFAMCSEVDYLYVHASDEHIGWADDIDDTEWLAFFQILTNVEMLFVSGKLAGQVARALEDVPGEMVTEVLPSLHSLMLLGVEEVSIRQFLSLRQFYGRPVTIRDASLSYTQ